MGGIKQAGHLCTNTEFNTINICGAFVHKELGSEISVAKLKSLQSISLLLLSALIAIYGRTCSCSSSNNHIHLNVLLSAPNQNPSKPAHVGVTVARLTVAAERLHHDLGLGELVAEADLA